MSKEELIEVLEKAKNAAGSARTHAWFLNIELGKLRSAVLDVKHELKNFHNADELEEAIEVVQSIGQDDVGEIFESSFWSRKTTVELFLGNVRDALKDLTDALAEAASDVEN